MKTSIKACAALIALGAAGAFMLDDQFIAGARQFVTGQVAQRLGPGEFVPGKSSQPRSGQGSAAVPVETARSRVTTTSAVIEAVGSLQSDESVQISSEVAGRIADIGFKEGQRVEAGAVLVQLDDALTRAELADAQARLELAEANYERTTSLARTGSATARAQDEAKSALASAHAAVDLIRVRLDKLSIRAPFPGTAGIQRVSVGAYVTPGSPIANFEKIDELKADFKVAEIFLSQLKVGQSIEVSVGALPGRKFPGEIYAIDPMVDVNGRALNVRARLGNPDLMLRPGLFARVTVKAGEERRVVMVPEEAIVPRGQETVVYRVRDGLASETRVTLGARRGGEVEITDGLDADEIIVTAGHTRLRDGSVVEIVPPAAVATVD